MVDSFASRNRVRIKSFSNRPRRARQRNLARFAGWSLSQAVAAASRNPARVARLDNKGVLAAGADADFVVLNPAGEVLRTFVGGVECSE